MKFIENIFEKIIERLGENAVGIIVLTLIAVLFVLFLLLKRHTRSCENKETVLFLLASFSVIFFYRFVLNFFGKSENEFSILSALVCVLAIPIKCVRGKSKKIDGSKEFIKFIDKKIAEQDQKSIANKLEIESPIEKSQGETVDGLNLSHVKNILKRLDYFDLTQADRRQVRELETAVFQAEMHFDDLEIKEKLNDGLGALLKIMAKYGV